MSINDFLSQIDIAQSISSQFTTVAGLERPKPNLSESTYREQLAKSLSESNRRPRADTERVRSHDTHDRSPQQVRAHTGSEKEPPRRSDRPESTDPGTERTRDRQPDRAESLTRSTIKESPETDAIPDDESRIADAVTDSETIEPPRSLVMLLGEWSSQVDVASDIEPPVPYGDDGIFLMPPLNLMPTISDTSQVEGGNPADATGRSDELASEQTTEFIVTGPDATVITVEQNFESTSDALSVVAEQAVSTEVISDDDAVQTDVVDTGTNDGVNTGTADSVNTGTTDSVNTKVYSNDAGEGPGSVPEQSGDRSDVNADVTTRPETPTSPSPFATDINAATQTSEPTAPVSHEGETQKHTDVTVQTHGSKQKNAPETADAIVSDQSDKASETGQPKNPSTTPSHGPGGLPDVPQPTTTGASTGTEKPGDAFSVSSNVSAAADKGLENAKENFANGRTDVEAKQLASRVTNAIRAAHKSGRQLKIRLHPPELGALQIEIGMQDGVTTARLEVQTVTAQQAILESLSLLKEALAQNGTIIDRIDVQLAEERPESGRSQSQDHRENRNEQSQPREQRQRDSQDETAGEPEDDASSQPGANIDELDIQI